MSAEHQDVISYTRQLETFPRHDDYRDLIIPFTTCEVTALFDFPNEEEKVLAFWKDIDAFRTSVKLSEGRPEFSFYDGPPFATGLPHYGHLLAGTIKVIAECADKKFRS